MICLSLPQISEYASDFICLKLLISKTFIAVGEVDDATIGELVLLNVVLHNQIILMGIDADVCIMRKAVIYDLAENAVNIRITGNAMDDVIGFYIIQPFTIIYTRVCRFRRW